MTTSHNKLMLLVAAASVKRQYRGSATATAVDTDTFDGSKKEAIPSEMIICGAVLFASKKHKAHNKRSHLLAGRELT